MISTLMVRGRFGRRQPDRGFSVIEILIVLAVVIVLVAISVPSIMNWVAQYRLGIGAQQVADSLQSAKMQAVSKTRRRELLFDVAGNRLGIEGATLVELPAGVAFDTGGVSVPPDPAIQMGEPVTFPSIDTETGLRAAAFTGKGLPDVDPGTVYAVFLTNTAGTKSVVVTSAGNVRIRSWDGSTWK
ncbi:MAG: hypothetical protein IPF53_04155 [Blastocatellia bacterium]|nr:hypothetical protein [Blastocatellia bacterium]MBK6428286.1 hypothetical protein [Blastocatellia bacterium]